jgi:hypothetical protein
MILLRTGGHDKHHVGAGGVGEGAANNVSALSKMRIVEHFPVQTNFGVGCKRYQEPFLKTISPDKISTCIAIGVSLLPPQNSIGTDCGG